MEFCLWAAVLSSPDSLHVFEVEKKIQVSLIREAFQ